MADDRSRIKSLEVPIVVELGRRTMTLSEVFGLLPGAIIDLGKPADEELDLLVNNQRIATGHAVKVGENFGIRVDRLGSADDLIAAAEDAQDEVSTSDASDLAAQFLAGQ
jgi:flagellar motor switch protein FliN/FliY